MGGGGGGSEEVTVNSDTESVATCAFFWDFQWLVEGQCRCLFAA